MSDQETLAAISAASDERQRRKAAGEFGNGNGDNGDGEELARDATGQLTRESLKKAANSTDQNLQNAAIDYYLADDDDVEQEFTLVVKRLEKRPWGGKHEFRTVREDELKNMQRRASTGKTLRTGVKEVDQYKLNRLLLVDTMINPNLKSTQIMQKHGTPADALERRLLPGEISELAERVLVKSGFSDDAVYELEDGPDEVELAKK